MKELDTQTLLNVLLAILSAYLAVRNFLLSSKKDVQRESQEMTEVRVQLQNVMSLLQDMQRDIRTNNADYRALAERVVIIETKLKTAFVRIDELRDGQNGKHEHHE